jgi:glycine/sarcosine/betaine reductase complex component A
VDKAGTKDLVVLLGTPNPESTELFAVTLTEGDPTWAGPLAGVRLGLPVFHITEPDIRGQIPEDVYDAQVGLAEAVLDTEAIAGVLRARR